MHKIWTKSLSHPDEVYKISDEMSNRLNPDSDLGLHYLRALICLNIKNKYGKICIC